MINIENKNKIDIYNKKITVIGMGLSGIGAAKLANHLGAKVFASDINSNIEISTNALKLMQKHHIAIETGIHSSKIFNSDLWILSPGIAKDSHLVKKAIKKNIPIVSEIEFASWYTNSNIIAITGSNGKTTTAHILYEMCQTKNINIIMAGNMGISFSESVLNEIKDPKKTVYILEISSFQLEFSKHFCPYIALYTNITEDHIDRHHSMSEYIAMKLRLVQNFKKGNLVIYNQDDKILTNAFINKKINKKTFSIKSNDTIFQINNNKIYHNSSKQVIIKISDITLKGDHNLYNLISAATCASLYGIKNNAIKKVLETFGGVEHRLEHISTINDIKFINDSKATNINSVIVALQTYSKSVILILGGYNKGANFKLLLPYINSNNVKAVIAYGGASGQIITALGDAVRSIKKIGLNSAVQKAHSIAKPGDIVLLSPGCASFDQFENFESRGDFFKSVIEKIA